MCSSFRPASGQPLQFVGRGSAAQCGMHRPMPISIVCVCVCDGCVPVLAEDGAPIPLGIQGALHERPFWKQPAHTTVTAFISDLSPILSDTVLACSPLPMGSTAVQPPWLPGGSIDLRQIETAAGLPFSSSIQASLAILRIYEQHT